MIQSGVAALEKGDGHSLRTAPWLESSGVLCIRNYHLEGVLERQEKPNAELSSAEIEINCRLIVGDHELLDRATDRLSLSARAYHRIPRVARTIADLAGTERIDSPHLTEAVGYRSLDREIG